MIDSGFSPALGLLLRMQVRGRLRKISRGARTVKGKLYLCLMMGMIALGLGPSVGAGLFMPPPDPGFVRSFLSPGLFLFALLTLITTGPDTGIFFVPPGGDYLLRTPFPRSSIRCDQRTGLDAAR